MDDYRIHIYFSKGDVHNVYEGYLSIIKLPAISAPMDANVPNTIFLPPKDDLVDLLP